MTGLDYELDDRKTAGNIALEIRRSDEHILSFFP